MRTEIEKRYFWTHEDFEVEYCIIHIMQVRTDIEFFYLEMNPNSEDCIRIRLPDWLGSYLIKKVRQIG